MGSYVYWSEFHTQMLLIFFTFGHVYTLSQCSVSCGKGIMVRKVTCQGRCSAPKPQMSVSCDAGPCADEGFWNAGAWSQVVDDF